MPVSVKDLGWSRIAIAQFQYWKKCDAGIHKILYIIQQTSKENPVCWGLDRILESQKLSNTQVVLILRVEQSKSFLTNTWPKRNEWKQSEGILNTQHHKP